jgi:hypothetical protein
MDAARDRQDAEQLLALLKKQNDLYRRLRMLADRQGALVVEDDVQPLLSLLAERQRVVDGLVVVNQELAPFRSDWSGRYASLDEPTRQEVAGLLEEANASLGLVLRNDQRDSATLSAKRMAVAERLSATDQAGRAGAAYSAAGLRPQANLTDAQA